MPKFCHNCGKNVKIEDSKFCNECGTSFIEKTNEKIQINNFEKYSLLANEKELPFNKSKAYSVDDIRKQYSRAYEPWTKEEDDKLIYEYQCGKTIKELIIIFGRQKGGIVSRLKKLGCLSQINTEIRMK